MTLSDELLAMIVDPVKREDAEQKYAERVAICIHDGHLTEQAATEIALGELRKKVGVCEQKELF